MPLIATRGAASAQGFGEFAQSAGPVYIEDVFSTFLYGTSPSPLTITNNIDLSGKGGLVWTKARNIAEGHRLVDTVRGATKAILSNEASAQVTESLGVTSFSSSGYVVNVDAGYNGAVGNSYTYASWTFREQAKFFDVVTYTGNGTSQNIAHNLGAVPGCIIVKQTSNTSNWMVYHRSLANTEALFLNLTNAKATGSSAWNSTTPTSTVFSVGANNNVNASGETYIAYLFAHNAGGFGLSGTDNVISCGSFTTDGSGNATVNLGYEPQWVIEKSSTASDNWIISDIMREMSNTSDSYLFANLSNAEVATGYPHLVPTATGFTIANHASSRTFIYIAIRRGPMKTPTSGTSVFNPVTYSGNGTNNRLVNTTITPDLIIDMRRDNVMNKFVLDRLRGNGRLYSNLTNAEASNTAQFPTNTFNVNQTGITVSADEVNASGRTFVLEAFQRAPGFFDVVCYTGAGAGNYSHNLAVAPELMIIKRRNDETNWQVYASPIGNTKYLELNLTAAEVTNSNRWNNTTPTASVFTLGSAVNVSGSGIPFVAYLFASCPGVSKVGSYTGTGTTQVINCGFTAGSRFVMIKRTDSTGDWYVWDSARGIVAGNDPYLLLNNDAAEVTNTDFIDTANSGFEISSTAPAAINANGGTFIFLAIA